MKNREEMDLISAICDRAATIEPYFKADKMSLFMDIDFTNQLHPLDLQRWLDADDGNFMHDLCGIHRHFDRETKMLTGCFMPRFASS